MPVVDITQVRAYAHCENHACPGYAQEEVDADRVETQYMFRDNGGDAPGIERSSVALQFADTDEDGESETRLCKYCERPRALSLETRRNYDHLSGFDQAGLVKGAKGFDAQKRNTEHDEAIASMQAQMAAQAATIQQLLDATNAEPDDRAELEDRLAAQEAELEQLRKAAATPPAAEVEPAAGAEPVAKKAAAKRAPQR